jgi:hypothetical protein
LLNNLVERLLVFLRLLLDLNLLLQLFDLDEVVADQTLYLFGVLARPHSSRCINSHAHL